MKIETEIVPPDTDEDGQDDDQPSVSISCHLSSTDDVGYSTSVHLYGARSNDPQQFADGLLGTALALAALRGPDFSWAVIQWFNAYDGLPSTTADDVPQCSGCTSLLCPDCTRPQP